MFDTTIGDPPCFPNATLPGTSAPWTNPIPTTTQWSVTPPSPTVKQQMWADAYHRSPKKNRAKYADRFIEEMKERFPEAIW